MTTGQLIKAKLKCNKMQQKDLADVMGISSFAVHKWTHDKSIPAARAMVDVCETLGITPQEWFDALKEVA